MSIKLFADPTSLIRNNLILSSGTILNDSSSPVLSASIPDNVPYTAFLDYLVQQSIAVADAGTLNIVLKPGRSLKTGPWKGTAFGVNTKNFFPGVKGLPDTIANGDSSPSDNMKNAYSHLQIGKSALGSSIWFLQDKGIVRIDAYKNLSQLLEPANPIPLGVNMYRISESSNAGDVKIGTGFYTPSDNIDLYPPVIIAHNSATSAQVGFGGLSAPNLSGNGGAHVKGDLNISGQIFGKIGGALAFNRRVNTVVMNTDTYSYETDATEPGASQVGHRATKHLRLNPSISPITSTSGIDYTNGPYTLNGFVLTQAVCVIDPSSKDQVYMRTLVEDTTTSTFSYSPWAVFEYGETTDTQTFVNLMRLTLTANHDYRFYIQLLKWTSRDGSNVYSTYDLTLVNTKFIMYALPASMDIRDNIHP